MALSDFRDTYSWQEAVELGPELVTLSEQLPASEELGLAFMLRQGMVNLPAAIAEDLLEADRYTRKPEIARIAAALDIIDKVYPALDTASARTKLEKLSERVATDDFGEQTPGAKKVYLPGAKPHAGPADPAPRPKLPSPSPIKPSPASVPVVPADKPDNDGHGHDHHDGHHDGDNHAHHDDHHEHDDEPAAPALKVPVTPDAPAVPPAAVPQEDHVHPDSVQ